jgi:Protein of unknown function (DUF1553)/Protein of unknown function (DUF1549)
VVILMTLRTTAVLTVLCLLTSSAALARPPHKKALADYFGTRLAPKLNDCRTCHLPDDPDAEDAGLDPDYKPHNDFGARLKAVRNTLRKAGQKSAIPNRLETVADEDSDGDGVANIIELLTGHFPGEDTDTPTPAEVAAGRKALASFRQSKASYAWNPFESVTRPPVPAVKAAAWVRNPIDAFVVSEHEARGLTHRPEASKAVLLRRVYLDLIGLPPTPDELHAFLDDQSPDAFERVVDRLLESPRYGERWGRHWMDVWRYSDWAGFGEQVRDSQPHIWHWRDWIIESLNRDEGYDRMIVAMLAADEAFPDDASELRATGYLVRNYKLLSREKWMQDVVDHTGQAFLGVTLGCARCHDHMYDPILQKEYYQVRAIFEPHNVRIDRIPGQPDTAKDGLPRAFDADLTASTFLYIRGDDRTPASNPLSPGVPEALGGRFPEIYPVALPRDAYAPDRRAFVMSDDLAAAQKAIDEAHRAHETAERNLAKVMSPLALAGSIPARIDWAGLPKSLSALDLAEIDVPLSEARRQSLAALFHADALEEAGEKDSEEWTEAATEAARAQRVQGELEARRKAVAARQSRRAVKPKMRAEADKALADAERALARAELALREPKTTAYTRRQLATYPKTSTGRRLAFARWIASSENPLTARVAMNHMWLRHFGQGIVPTVSDFGRNGRPATNPALLDWLASEFVDRGWSMKAMHRLIVTSETYRQDSKPDSSNLAIDPDNTYNWRMTPRRVEAEIVRDCVFAVADTLDLTMGGPDIDYQQGLTVPRRTVYFRHAAEKQMEFLKIFDGPSVTECYRRHETTLPQQALALANSELSLSQSRVLARALANRTGSDPAAFITAAFEQLLSRPPTKDEMVECAAFLQLREQKLATSEPQPTTTDSPGREPAADAALRSRENLVHVLMNHHEFVTVR